MSKNVPHSTQLLIYHSQRISKRCPQRFIRLHRRNRKTSGQPQCRRRMGVVSFMARTQNPLPKRTRLSSITCSILRCYHLLGKQTHSPSFPVLAKASYSSRRRNVYANIQPDIRLHRPPRHQQQDVAGSFGRHLLGPADGRRFGLHHFRRAIYAGDATQVVCTCLGSSWVAYRVLEPHR